MDAVEWMERRRVDQCDQTEFRGLYFRARALRKGASGKFALVAASEAAQASSVAAIIGFGAFPKPGFIRNS
jgi:hypothetical protein